MPKAGMHCEHSRIEFKSRDQRIHGDGETSSSKYSFSILFFLVFCVLCFVFCFVFYVVCVIIVVIIHTSE